MKRLFALLVLFSAAGSPVPDANLGSFPAESYFPLEIGWEWTYRLNDSTDDFRLSVTRRENLDGKDCLVVETRQADNRRDSFFYRTPQGLMQPRNELSSFKPHLLFLPSSLSPGKQWSWEGDAAPAGAVGEGARKEKRAVEILKPESVTTPAGTFTCIPIRYTEKDAGGQTTLQSVRWYAPRVGRVKIEHSYFDNGVVSSKSTIELTGFKRPDGTGKK